MSEEREGNGREPNRSDDILGRRDSPCRRELEKTWDQVRRGFEDQYDRANLIEDYWEAYNCHLNDKQTYDGTAEVYIPSTHDAINAIVTRNSNQLFPEGSHYVDVVTDEATKPNEIIALLDKYLTDNQAKNHICKPLLRHGIIEGQFNLYVDWLEIRREVVSKERHGPRAEIAGEEIEIPGEDIDDIDREDIIEARPIAEVLHDSDVLVLPASADSIDEALAAGGLVAIVRRWSKAKVEALLDAEIIVNPGAEQLIELMDAQYDGRPTAPPDLERALQEMVGIRQKGMTTTCWEVWKMLPLNDSGKYSKGGTKRLCQIFFGYDKIALGCRRNPHWNDRCPLISEPVEKVGGVFKGKSQVEYVISLQYEANDAANEGADMSHMSACGLVLRDPTTAGKQPLVMNIGAVWDVPPDSIRFAEFPDLTDRAAKRIQYGMQQTFQTMGVNPSMLPQQTSTARRNQAQIAQEQQVDLLTTSEQSSVLVDGVLTPTMGWWVDLDYQHRDKEMSARFYGALGVKASMMAVKPQLNRSSYLFKWVGMERARNAQVFQQKIGFLNVARGLEPVLAQAGYRLNLAMPVEQGAIDLWGPHDGPKVIEDMRSQLSMDPELENQLMNDGHVVPTHALDDDQRHLQSHAQDMQQNGDPSENKKLHIQWHIKQMNMKQQAAMQQAMQQGMQQQMQGGRPGGQPQQPGRGGAPPRQGAMPGGPQLVKGPPGAIHQDQMPRAGAVPMPRRY